MLADIERALECYAPGASSPQYPKHCNNGGKQPKKRNIDEPDVTAKMAENGQCYTVTPVMEMRAREEVFDDGDPFANLYDPRRRDW